MSKATRDRWKRGGFEHEIRIRVQCAKNPSHAKILRFDGAQWKFELLVTLGTLLDGTSPAYILKPGPSSPIGRCAVCGGDLESTVEEMYYAQPQKPIDQPAEHPR